MWEQISSTRKSSSYETLSSRSRKAQKRLQRLMSTANKMQSLSKSALIIRGDSIKANDQPKQLRGQEKYIWRRGLPAGKQQVFNDQEFDCSQLDARRGLPWQQRWHNRVIWVQQSARDLVETYQQMPLPRGFTGQWSVSDRQIRKCSN